MQKTKVIRVFIAASENLAEVKTAVFDLLNQLNRHFLPRGIEFVPTLPTESATDGDLAVVLYWKDFGDLPKVEFEQAYEVFKKEAQPKIYVFFREPAPDAMEALKAFRDSFATKYGHFYCHFETVDSVKFQMTVQSLALLPEAVAQDALKIDGEKIVMGSATVASLENLPFAKLNSRRRILQRKVAKAAQEVEELEGEVDAAPDDEDLKDSLRQARVAHNALREELRQHDGFLFGLAMHIAKESTKGMDERVRKARELFEQGKAREANQLLALPEMETQANRNLELFQANRDACEKDIQAFATKARLVLVDDSLTMAKRIEEACQSYDNAIRIAREIHLDGDRFAAILYDYGLLLVSVNKFAFAIEKLSEALEKYRRLAKETPGVYESDVSKTLNSLAILHNDINFLDDAEREYQEALLLCRKPTGAGAGKDEVFEAALLSNLGSLHGKEKRFDLAEQEYHQALEIFRRLAKSNSDVYDSNVAGMLMNLATLHLHRNWEAAELEFRDALKIYNRLIELKPDVYLPVGAQVLNNLAVLHSKKKNWDEAEREYGMALAIRTRLSEMCPEAYDDDVAGTLNNLASLHSEMKCWEKAESEYERALEIYRRLSETDPNVYNECVAGTLHNLALLHLRANLTEEAEREFVDALTIRRKLVEANPVAYESDFSVTMNELANLHMANNHIEDAERVYRDALELYHRLVKSNPGVFEPGLSTALNNLATLHCETKNWAEAECELDEAVRIYRRLATTDPDAYESLLATMLHNRGNLFSDTSRWEEAERDLREELEIYIRLAKSRPDMFKPCVATSLNNLAIFLDNRGKTEEADRDFVAALELRRRLAVDHPGDYEEDVASSLYNLAVFLFRHGKNKEALESAEEMKSLCEQHPQQLKRQLLQSKDLIEQLRNTKHEKKESEMSKEQISAVVRAYLDGNGIHYKSNPGDDSLTFGFRLKCKLNIVHHYMRFQDDGYVMYGVSPINAKQDCLGEVLKFTAMVNYGFVPGNFEVDIRDGEIRFKIWTKTRGGEVLSRQVIDEDLAVFHWVFERFGDSLADLAMGLSDAETEYKKTTEGKV